MWKQLKQAWAELKKSRPGKRFQDLHDRRKSKRKAWQAPLLLALGAVLTIAGVIMLVIPGPGLLFIFAGLAVIARESRWVAQALDGLELWLQPLIERSVGVWRAYRNG